MKWFQSCYLTSAEIVRYLDSNRLLGYLFLFIIVRVTEALWVTLPEVEVFLALPL